MKRRQRLHLAFTIHYGDALFVVVVGLSGFARRLAETGLSASGSTAAVADYLKNLPLSRFGLVMVLPRSLES
jgi:hypothetical protein